MKDAAADRTWIPRAQIAALRATAPGQKPTLDLIYLDHNSTTPLLAEVAAAMAECQATVFGNPASQHQAGRRARQVLEDAREAIGRMLGADVASRQPDQVIFTSGGTEANNLAILGLAGDTPGEAIISAIEHPSVAGAGLNTWSASAGRIHRLRGLGGMAWSTSTNSRDLLGPNTRLVSVMLGNNETGALQPVAEMAELCHR